MQLKQESRCKDETPNNTITKIKKILNMLNIFTYEEWYESMPGIYSVHLQVEQTNIFSNGKGTNREYALASAYGELIERLQNFVYFRFSNCRDFFITSEDFILNKKDILTKSIDEIEEQKTWWTLIKLSPDDVARLQKTWKEYYSSSDSCVSNICFRNLNDMTKELLLPYKMVEYYYGSNGMAAGNTFEEAAVQGLSEILERYIIQKCVKEKITPLDITEYAINKYDFVSEAQVYFQTYGYTLYIKDLSIINKIPGIAVVITNSKMEYFVCTGVHPIEEIAIERTLTEICQGKDFCNFPFNISAVKETGISKHRSKNLTSIYVGFGGVYPKEFFCGEKCDYTHGFEDYKIFDNAYLLKKLEEIIQSIGGKVYYIDVSFLKFPTYHFIVPGISEINSLKDIGYLKKFEEFERACGLMRNLNALSKEQAVFLIHYINESDKSINYLDFVQVPFKNKEPYKAIDKYMLLTMLYIFIEDYYNAKINLDKYIDLFSDLITAHSMEQYYKELSIVLDMYDKYSVQYIEDFLCNFNSLNNVNEIYNMLQNKTVFDEMPNFAKENINHYANQNDYTYANEINLFNKLLQLSC